MVYGLVQSGVSEQGWELSDIPSGVHVLLAAHSPQCPQGNISSPKHKLDSQSTIDFSRIQDCFVEGNVTGSGEIAFMRSLKLDKSALTEADP